MIVLMLIFVVVIFALILIVSGFDPKHSGLSHFELERRRNNGEPAAMAAAEREEILIDIVSLQRMIVALLLVIFTGVTIGWFGWIIGIILSCVVALGYGAIARIGVINSQSQRVYRHSEAMLIQLIKKYPAIFRIIRHAVPATHADSKLESREELLHLITKSQHILTNEEKSLMTHGLKFASRKVSEVMIPRGQIESIGAKEMLGPLVLDDLHKTGHTRFPVIDKDIDHVIGLLHIQDLLSLDNKRTVTAEKAMEPRVFYIRQDQTLQHALMAFLRTHHHLFIVVNEDQETVGVISLEDTIEALIGHKIVDEFDTHSDIRNVARRAIRTKK
jgi:CBS domain containing-hemolysin-like protein